MANISLDTTPHEMLQIIAGSREKVGLEKETTGLINQAQDVTHDLMVNLYLEKCAIFQHLLMTERDKPQDKRDNKLVNKVVKDWQRTLREMERYVAIFKLKRWVSRIHRTWGRLLDAQGKYALSIPHYKKSIRLARLDPEFIEKGVPRWIEAEGFVASALILSGKTEEGLARSRKIYKKYDVDEGKQLKEKDYATWAIWKTGIPIRIGLALLTQKFDFDRQELTRWLGEAEKLLTPPPEVKVWVDFGFRKNEIAAIRRELKI